MSRSRTYKEAEEGSQYLLSCFPSHRPPFASALNALSDSGQLRITGPEDAGLWESAAQKRAHELCIRISPQIAIPVLLQATHDSYYGSNKQQQPWIGPALKITLAFIWEAVFNPPVQRSESLTVLEEAVSMVSVFDQLQAIRVIYELGGKGEVLLDGESFTLSGNIADFAKLSQSSFGKGGKLHRTLSDSIKALLTNPVDAFLALEAILKGENPQEAQAFRGTIFGAIPPNQPSAFWSGLFVRLLLMAAADDARMKARKNHEGIAVLEKDSFLIPASQQRLLLERAFSNLFWEEQWYRQQIGLDARNMIVDRPAVVAVRNSHMFFTSTLFAGDSLTWFVESSILPYEGHGGVPLDSVVFERLVSNPFEARVRRMFQEYGFKAGPVTKGGAWLIANGHVVLTHPRGEKCPGQIDVLAYNASLKLVFLVECKVIGFPHTPARLRNIVLKLGLSDAEKFRSKVRGKLRWIRESGAFPTVSEHGFIGAIVLDRRFPILEQGKPFVVDVEHLKNILDRFCKNKSM